MLITLYLALLLQGLVLLAVAYLLVQRLLRHLKQRYINGRIQRFQPAVLQLLEDPQALSPLAIGLRPFDAAIIEALLLQQAEELRGVDRENMTLVFESLGYAEKSVHRLQSRAWWRRLDAAIKLGAMRSNTSITHLLIASSDPVEDVRLGAVRALCQVNDTRGLGLMFQAMENSARWAPERVAEAILAIGPAASAAIREQLQQTRHPESKLLLIRLAGLLRDAEGSEGLLGILEGAADKDTRSAAVRALGEIGDPIALERLMEALGDPDWEVRAEAARSLGLLQSQDAIALLSETLVDPRIEVRYRAAWALWQVGEKGRSLLQSISKNGDTLAAGIATQILAEAAIGVESVHV